MEKTTTPFPVLAGEIRIVYAWCQADKSSLMEMGLQWEIVESLPILCDTCESLYVNYTVEKKSIMQYRREMTKKFRAASATRTVIAKRIRYALFLAGSSQKIPVYHRRKSYLMIIEDLINLVALCDHFSDILVKSGYNQEKNEQVKELAEQLENDLTNYDVLLFDYKQLQKQYVSSYQDLFRAVQIIRKCAFEVFAPGSPRRRGYRSEYRDRP
jgi:hypothetical protein